MWKPWLKSTFKTSSLFSISAQWLIIVSHSKDMNWLTFGDAAKYFLYAKHVNVLLARYIIN